MIEEIEISVGGQTINRYSGGYLLAMVQRDFTKDKKELYNNMTGNIEELKSSAQILGLLSDQMGAWVKENTFDLSKLEEIILASRDKAMKTNEFTELDNLKNLFITAGLDVQMSKDGIKLIKGPKFNSSLLEDFL